MPTRARPLSRSQLAFESLLERDDDDGQDPVQLPPRGQRNPKKKERGGGGGGRGVKVLDECELAAERRRTAASSSSAAAAAAAPAASPAPSAAFDELQSRFPRAPRDLLRDVLGASSGGVEEAAEALRSLGLVGSGGEEEKTEEEANNTPSVPPPPPRRTPAMLTEGLWGGLPPDMQRLIYARLGPRDAARAALSCREFAARARAARARPAAVEVAAPRASLRAIEGQVAAFHGARSVSLARWRLHLDAFEAGNAAGAAAEAASAAAQQGRHWHRRAWQQQLQQARSSSSSSSASALPPQLRVADPERVLEAIEGALAAVARGSERRAELVESSARASGGGSGSGGGAQGGEENPFYLPTLDAAADASRSEAAEVEHLTFPRLSHGNGNGTNGNNSTGDCCLPLEHCERLARRAREVLPGLRSARFDDVGGGDGPRGLCRGLSREDTAGLEESDEDEDEGEEDDDGDGEPARALHSIAITGAPALDEESVQALLRSWSTSAAASGKTSRRRQQQEELLAVDFSRCPLLTSAAFSWPRLAPSDRPVLRHLRSVTLDGCKGLERFELNCATFPSLERLSLRDCRRLAEIVVVASPSGRQRGGQAQLVELRVSGCAALRSIGAAPAPASAASSSAAAAPASLPRLERIVAAGCASLVALPSRRPSPLLVEANFFGCRSLPSSALEAFLGTGDTAAEAAAAEAAAAEAAAAGAAAPPIDLNGSRLASLNLNGCVSLSRVRILVASPALESLDASGCRSCVEVDLGGCSAESLRSLRLDGCRALSRLALPGEPGRRGGFVVSGSAGSAGSGGVVSTAFLDPAATSAAGVPEEVAALVAAATVKKAKRAKKEEGDGSGVV